MYKGRLALALAGICVLTLVTESHATTVAEMSRQKSQTESNLQSVNSEISQIEARQEQLKIEVGAMDTQLVEVLASISICKDEIIAKEEEVSRAKVDLEKAQKKEQEQYDAMKQRIRFMYEKGDNAYLQLFFEAKSLADMINKADYVEKLYTYDRDLLQTYTNVKNETKEKQQLLEEEEAELLAANYELEQEQASLEQMINEKKATIENFDAQLVRARVEAQKYKRELTKQTQQLRTLEEKERQKAAEKESEKKPAKSEDAQQGDNGETSNGNGTSQNGPAQGEGAQNGEVQPDGENENAEPEQNGTGVADDVEKTQPEESQTSETSTGDAESAKGESETKDQQSTSGKKIADYACKFVGNPYKYGGTSLTEGTDCSGFTMSVYAHFGYSIPRDSTSQRSAGRAVSYSEAQPGDIICYAGHVAIYIGNGQIVHASTEATGIKYGVATYRTILSVRRIVD